MKWPPRFVGRLGKRWSFFFAKSYWLTVLVIGGGLEVAALTTWTFQPWASIFAGVGGSVLATVLVSFMGPAGDKVYQTFLRLGVTEFYSSRNRFPSDRWVDWLSEAKHTCILLGQAHGNWSDDRRFRGALLERIKEGVTVEIFFLDPNGDAAKVRSKEDRKNIKPLLGRIRASITEVWKIRQELSDKAKAQLKLYVYNATPSLGLTWVDEAMVVTHYLAGITNLTSPALLIEYRPAPDTLYAIYEENVKEIRAHSSTSITDENIATFTTEVADARQ